MRDMTATDIVTAIVALYGAGLSTFIAVREWKARRPDIKVEVSEGRTYIAELGDWSAHRIFIKAYNRGQKTVNFTMVGIILPDGNKLAIPYPLGYLTLPCELLPELSCTAETSAKELAADLKVRGFPEKVSLVGYYDDAVGRRHISKPTIFDTSTEKLAK